MSPSISDIQIDSVPQNKHELISAMIETIFDLTEEMPDNFAGTCILSYNDEFEMEHRCRNMRPSVTVPSDLVLGSDDFNNYLRTIATSDNPLHDGFVLVDQDGNLSHVSQFIQVQIDPNLEPHDQFGTRFYSSLLATKISGVELAGNVSCSGTGMIFLDGKVYFC